MATAKLTPAMQAALLRHRPGHASLGTVRALRARGLTYFDGTREQLTEAGLTARAELREPTGQETRMPIRNASAVGAHLAAALTRPANGTVVTNVADLSKDMRAGLTDRYRVPTRTAHALERRGLVEVGPKLWIGGHRVTLTPAGERARDALLTELVPGIRVRNTMTGLVGTLVRLDHGDDHDMVVLRWDGWDADTAGSPVYLEVITEPDDGSTVVEVLPDQRQCYRGRSHPAHLHTSNVYPHPEYRCPGVELAGSTDADEPVDSLSTTVDYNGIAPSTQQHEYDYGFLRSAVLGQAAGRPFADPMAAVRHLDECLRLAGYTIPALED